MGHGVDRGWRSFRLRHLARVNPRVPLAGLPVGQRVTFVPLECVWPNPHLDVSRTRAVDEVASGYTRFMEGDVLVPKITPTFEAGRSAVARGLDAGGPGFGTTELHVLRPGPLLDGRFLAYRTLAVDFLGAGTAAMVGVAGQRRVPVDFVKDFRVELPPVAEQRRIADFLDGEVARLGAIRADRAAMAADLKEMVDARILERVLPATRRWPGGAFLDQMHLGGEVDGWRPIRLKYCAQGVQAGIWGEEADGGPNDVACVRVADFDYPRGRIAPASTMRSAPAKQSQPRLLQPGDLLLEKSGGGDQQPVGRVVVVEDVDRPTVCSNFVARMRPESGFDPGYLQLVHRALYFSGLTRLSIKQTTGIQNLDVAHYLSHTIPFPDLPEQVRVRDELTELVATERELARSIDAQIGLIDEHRETLITAAVTGQLDPASSRPMAMA